MRSSNRDHSRNLSWPFQDHRLRARAALEPLRRAIGARTVEDAAEDVVRVVEGNMEKAIRTITVQRGQDPRGAVLLPFGGAAGLHACGLAATMGFSEVLVPKDPGLLSAIGVRDGSVGMDRLVPLVATNPEAAWLASRAKQPAARLRAEVAREGFARREVNLTVFVRLRYARQAIELEVPLGPSYRRDFDRAHQRLFHASDAAWPVEVVGLRKSDHCEPNRRKRYHSTPCRMCFSPRPTVQSASWFAMARRSAGKSRTAAKSLLSAHAMCCKVVSSVSIAVSSATLVIFWFHWEPRCYQRGRGKRVKI